MAVEKPKPPKSAEEPVDPLSLAAPWEYPDAPKTDILTDKTLCSFVMKTPDDADKVIKFYEGKVGASLKGVTSARSDFTFNVGEGKADATQKQLIVQSDLWNWRGKELVARPGTVLVITASSAQNVLTLIISRMKDEEATHILLQSVNR